MHSKSKKRTNSNLKI